MEMVMRPTTLAKGATLCALALVGFILATPPKAQAYTVIDLPNLGYSVLSDNKGNGCIAWSAGIPGFARTLIGQDCWPTFQTLLDNYIAASLPALQAHQAAHATTAAPAATVTVTKTVFDSAGGTFTVTVERPGVTVTTPPQTVTTPAQTTTETETRYLTTPELTITVPGPILDHYITVTREVASPPPPPETVTETQTTTETQTVEHTRTITVKQAAPKPPKRATRMRAFRTG